MSEIRNAAPQPASDQVPRGVAADQRSHTRVSLHLKVDLQFDDLRVPITSYTANVSEGGMFVALGKPPPVGSMVRFTMYPRDGAEPVRGLADVVWIRLRTVDLREPTGIGLAFRSLNAASHAQIALAIRQAPSEPWRPTP